MTSTDTTLDRPCISCGHLTNPTSTGVLCTACWDGLDAGQVVDLASPAATADPVMWRRAAGHRHLSEPLARALAWVSDLDTLAALAANPVTPVEVLDLLVDHPRPAVAAVAAATRTNAITAPAAVLVEAPLPVVHEPAPPPWWVKLRARIETRPAAAGIAVAMLAVLLAVAVVVSATTGNTDPRTVPSTTRPPAPTSTSSTSTSTSLPVVPVEVDTWAGVTGQSDRPRSVWACGPGPATVTVTEASGPVYLWVEGLTTGDAAAGDERTIDHHGGSVDFEVYAETPTVVSVTVTCIPAAEDG